MVFYSVYTRYTRYSKGYSRCILKCVYRISKGYEIQYSTSILWAFYEYSIGHSTGHSIGYSVKYIQVVF